nr:lasso peptide biosynthesis B2 protein [Streptomyces sp. SID3343]
MPYAPEARDRLPLWHRPAPLLAVAAARVLTLLSPGRMRKALVFARGGASGPATAAQVSTARRAVVAVSARCAGEGCVQRSVATALLCRARGVWPTWCSGVRTEPFRAHAWVEVDGRPVGEPASTGLFHRIMTVPAPAPPDRAPVRR